MPSWPIQACLSCTCSQNIITLVTWQPDNQFLIFVLTLGHMVDFLLAVRVSACPSMYMPCLARDSMTLIRFDVFKKPICPCLQFTACTMQLFMCLVSDFQSAAGGQLWCVKECSNRVAYCKMNTCICGCNANAA